MEKKKGSIDENTLATYGRRYIILILLCASTLTSSFQVYEQTSIGNVIVDYYSVTYIAVSWTANLNTIPNILLFYYIGKFINSYGLRKTMLAATFLCAVGSIIKCAALDRDHFWLLIIAKIFPCFLNVIFFYLAPVLAANWFKPNEAGLVIATVNALFAIGMCATFSLPILFKDASIDEIKKLFLTSSITCVLIYVALFCLIMLIVVDKPPTPPSLAAKKRSESESTKLKILISNRNFVLVSMITLFVFGFTQVFPLSLNESILSNFKANEGKDRILSLCGTLYLVFKFFGGFISPSIVRKYPKYKLILLLYLISTLLFTTLYLLSLSLACEWLLYASVAALGIVFSGFIVLIIDYAIEASFPFPESISVGIIYMTYSVSALILTQIVTILAQMFDTLCAYYVFVFVQAAAILLSMFLTEELNRRKANCEESDVQIKV
ncbi:putative MFS-type transporter -like protein [Dinothrombium tinctorium]|uniref:Putative MFS-type transporter-like protein n=1 Tax=Dinothrombium tinctorium TaxID=1965070 RepID=A0A3S4QQ56_9ACAR|nr:putative MFS-type transporter -like protein [Dinothrombium tinctorium]